MGKAVGIIDLLADDFSGYGQIERLGVGVCRDGHLFFKIAEHFRVIRDSDESLGAGTDAVCGPTHSRAAAVGVDFGDDEGCRAAVFEFKGCFGGLLPENAAQFVAAGLQADKWLGDSFERAEQGQEGEQSYLGLHDGLFQCSGRKGTKKTSHRATFQEK